MSLPAMLAWVFCLSVLGVTWHYDLLFFIGGVLGWWLQEKHPSLSEVLTFAAASGRIAGESLMGVGLVMWENGPEVARKLFGR